LREIPDEILVIINAQSFNQIEDPQVIRLERRKEVILGGEPIFI